MRIIKFLEGKQIYLRPLKENDLELVEFGKNNPDVRETLFLFAPMTTEQVKAELNQWSSSKEIMLFTICRQQDDVAVGQTALVRIDYVSRAAVFYVAIYDPQFWSKGYGSEATRMMLKFSFDILNLNRVQLHVCVDNTKGVAAYKKAGFKVEGTLRKAMYHKNKYIDFYVMGILREEFYKRKK
ncbi:MAG: GNAT family protein [Ignavibacteriales bacterium]|nr:GNAT family protein [Ignavibacteriales bacterium]